jgi:reticulon-4-interacting protein 1, mitochondrial
MAIAPTRLLAMCLGPDGGGGFDIREVPRRNPGPDEVEIAVEAASVNPIEVRRAAGYGRRLLSLMGASRFPMTLGNDFAGVVADVGSGRASGFAIGERVYGVKPPSKDGTHASHVLERPLTRRRSLRTGSFRSSRRCLTASSRCGWPPRGPGSRVKTPGERRFSSMAQPAALECWLCRRCLIGERRQPPWPKRRTLPPALRPAPRMRSPATTLNFATWEDEANLLSCLREGALGHATTVHPLMQNFDDGGWVAGALRTIQQKRKMRAALPGRTRNYAWVLFRPEREALSEMARFVELGRLSLPIGIRAPLRDAPKAFDHVRRHAPGRALLIP